MKLYRVETWFSKENPDAGGRWNYGFLRMPEGGERLFFHRSAIVPDSALRGKEELKGLLIVCAAVPSSKKQGQKEASDVKLFTEVSPETQRAVAAAAFANASLLDLRRYMRSKYSVMMEHLKEIFLQKCQQESLSELEKNCRFDAEVERIFVQRFDNAREEELSELLENKSLSDLGFTLPDKYPVIRDQLRKRFLQRCQQESLFNLMEGRYLFDQDVREVVCEKCWKEPLSNLISDKYLDNGNIREIFLQRCQQETVESLVPLVRQIRRSCSRADFLIAKILPHQPKILNDTNLCATLTPRCFDFEMETCLVQNEVQLKFLMKHLPDDTKKYVINHHTDTQVVLRNEEAWRLADDHKLAEMVSLIDWHNTTPQYMDAWNRLLSLIEADVQMEAAAAIAISMREKNAVFHPVWWERFNDSIKIRILIYQSNFLEEISTCASSFHAITAYEKKCDNKLLCAVLAFFDNFKFYSAEEEQRNFTAGHQYLMDYITDCFSPKHFQGVTHGLNTLLDKCQQHEGGSSPYFCDAKTWAARGLVYCPEGRNRPGGGRCACSFFPGADLTATKFKQAESPKYSEQYLADLYFNIGFKPDLSEIGVQDPVLYPYRIAALVNRFIDMLPHMRCSNPRCKSAFGAMFEYSKKLDAKLSMTRFKCSKRGQNSGDHDTDVYLNYCCNCQRVVDSRECKKRDEGYKGQLVCMRCGATQKIKDRKILPICPREGCENRDRNQFESHGKYIYCKVCKYDGKNFYSRCEQEEISRAESHARTVQCDANGFDFKDELPFW